MRRAGDDAEAGQTTVLLLGVITIVLILTAVIIGATTVTLNARHLLSEADGAASAAANAPHFDGREPVVTDEAAIEAATAYLNTSGAHQRHSHLSLERAWTSDEGQTVHVELSASAELPVIRWVLPADVTVTADSHARITLNR